MEIRLLIRIQLLHLVKRRDTTTNNLAENISHLRRCPLGFEPADTTARFRLDTHNILIQLSLVDYISTERDETGSNIGDTLGIINILLGEVVASFRAGRTNVITGTRTTHTPPFYPSHTRTLCLSTPIIIIFRHRPLKQSLTRHLTFLDWCRHYGDSDISCRRECSSQFVIILGEEGGNLRNVGKSGLATHLTQHRLTCGKLGDYIHIRNQLSLIQTPPYFG